MNEGSNDIAYEQLGNIAQMLTSIKDAINTFVSTIDIESYEQTIDRLYRILSELEDGSDD